MPEEEKQSGTTEIVETITTSVISYDVSEASLKEMESRLVVKKMPTDLSVKKNYDIVKEAVKETRVLRGKVEDRRKNLKSDALEYGRKVDAKAKSIKDRLLAIEEPIKKLKTDHDTKVEIAKREKARIEEERVSLISTKISNIRALVGGNVSSTSAQIKEALDLLAAGGTTEEWADEFADTATEATTEAKEKLTELFDLKLAAEEVDKKAKEDEAKRKADEKKAQAVRDEEAKKLKVKLEKEREQIAKDKIEIAKAQKEIAAAKAKLKAEAAPAPEPEPIQEPGLNPVESPEPKHSQGVPVAMNKPAVVTEKQKTAVVVKQILNIINSIEGTKMAKVEAIVAAIKADKINYISWEN